MAGCIAMGRAAPKTIRLIAIENMQEPSAGIMLNENQSYFSAFSSPPTLPEIVAHGVVTIPLTRRIPLPQPPHYRNITPKMLA
jgi:hypothetical protein